MAATSIDFQASDDGTPSPYVPLDGVVEITAVPDDDVENFQWRVTGGLRIVGGDRGRSVRLLGDTVDPQVGGSTVSVTVDDGVLSASLSLTVVSVDEIVATVTSTPPSAQNTARAAMQLADPAPTTFRSQNNDQEGFSRGRTLIMVGGQFPDVQLQATVRPAGVPIVWSSARSSDDGQGTAGLTLGATTGTTTTFSTAAIGAYFVNATIDVRDGISTEDDAMFKALPVVLIGVTAVQDNSQFNAAFQTDSDMESLRFASTGFGTVTRSRSFMYASGLNFVEFDGTITVCSGGPDGRLFLDDLHAAWIQTERGGRNGGSEMIGTYASGHTVETRLVKSWFAAGRTYVFDLAIADPIAYPLPDATDGSVPPTVARARLETTSNGNDPGQTWRMTAEDLPNVTMPLAFAGGDPIYEPTPGDDVLQTVALDMQFSAYICLWTKTMPQVFGVAYRLDWGLTGQWTVTVVPNQRMTATPINGNNPAVNHQGVMPNPIQASSADRQGAEVLGPGNVNHLVLAQVPPN